MTSKQILERLAATIICALSAGTTLAGDGPTTSPPSPYDPAVMVTHQINDHLYMIEATGLAPQHIAGNILVSVGDDGVLLVDDQFLPLAPRIREAVSALSSEPIRFVINTHGHADHADGNPAFGGPDGAVIIAHKNARESLMNSHDVHVKALGRTVHVPAMDPAGWPQITLEQVVEVHHNGDTIRVIYLGRGHTNADVLVHFVESNVIHMGDAYVQYGLPWIDLYNNGSAEGLVNAFKVAEAIADEETVIVPGHGDLADLASMMKTADALETIVMRVQDGIGEGLSLEDVQKTRPTRDFGDPGIVGADYFVEVVYESLQSESEARSR